MTLANTPFIRSKIVKSDSEEKKPDSEEKKPDEEVKITLDGSQGWDEKGDFLDKARDARKNEKKLERKKKMDAEAEAKAKAEAEAKAKAEAEKAKKKEETLADIRQEQDLSAAEDKMLRQQVDQTYWNKMYGTPMEGDLSDDELARVMEWLETYGQRSADLMAQQKAVEQDFSRKIATAGMENTMPMLVREQGEDIVDQGIGGRPNMNKILRFLMWEKYTQQLRDKKSEDIADEVRRTNRTVGNMPQSKRKGATFDPTFMSFGIPVPTDTFAMLGNLKNSLGKKYSGGFQSSFAAALLAAMGLGDEKGAESITSLIDPSALPFYEYIRTLGGVDENANSAAVRRAVLRYVSDDPGELYALTSQLQLPVSMTAEEEGKEQEQRLEYLQDMWRDNPSSYDYLLKEIGYEEKKEVTDYLSSNIDVLRNLTSDSEIPVSGPGEDVDVEIQTRLKYLQDAWVDDPKKYTAVLDSIRGMGGTRFGKYLREEEYNMPRGEKAFKGWLQAVRDMGVFTDEDIAKWRESLRRAAILQQMKKAAIFEDENGKNRTALENLRKWRADKNKRYFYPDDKKIQDAGAAAEEALNNFLENMSPIEGAPRLTNPTDVLMVLYTALKGADAERGDSDLREIGSSIISDVTKRIYAADEGAPVTESELAKTRENYEWMREFLNNPPQEFMANAIRNRADVLRNMSGGESAGTFMRALITKMDGLANAVEANGLDGLTDEDYEFLDTYGAEPSPQNILAYMFGSLESAKKYSKLLSLNYMDERGDEIMDYFTDPALVKSQVGLYMRNLVNSLAGEMKDAIDGRDYLTPLRMKGAKPSFTQMLRYALFRAPNDSAYLRRGQVLPLRKKDRKSNALLSDDEIYQRTQNEKMWDRIEAARTKGDWLWMDKDVGKTLSSILAGNEPTKANWDVLKRMGFVRERGISDLLSSPDVLEKTFRSLGKTGALDKNAYIRGGVLSTYALLSSLLNGGLLSAIGVSADELKKIGELSDALKGYIGDNGMAAYAGKQKKQFDATQNAAKKYIKKYMSSTGNAIGLKNFDTDRVDDLYENWGDILLHFAPNTPKMLRPQTYAAALSAVLGAGELEDELAKINQKIDIGDDDESKALWSRKGTLENKLKNAKQQVAYADSAISMDRNLSSIDKEWVTTTTQKLMDELAGKDQDDVDEDQLKAAIEETGKLISDLDPKYVLMNAIIEKAAQYDPSFAKYAPGADNLGAISQFLGAMKGGNLRATQIGSMAIDPINSLSDEERDELSSEVVDEYLYGIGPRPDEEVKYLFPYYQPVDRKVLDAAIHTLLENDADEDEDLADILDAVLDLTEADDASEEYERIRQDEEPSYTISYFFPELAQARDEIYHNTGNGAYGKMIWERPKKHSPKAGEVLLPSEDFSDEPGQAPLGKYIIRRESPWGDNKKLRATIAKGWLKRILPEIIKEERLQELREKGFPLPLIPEYKLDDNGKYALDERGRKIETPRDTWKIDTKKAHASLEKTIGDLLYSMLREASTPHTVGGSGHHMNSYMSMFKSENAKFLRVKK